jgi:hypothetical protein
MVRPLLLTARVTVTSVLAFVSITPVRAETPPSGDVAWGIVADLTTDVGQRLAGTPREAVARDWAVARLKRLGFANPHVEAYTMPGWVRGEERADVTAPVPQHLAVTALGNSGATPAAGISAELVYFASLDALQAAPAGSLKGRIAFIDHAMRATQDGEGYGPYGNVRRQGPALAAAKGAVAVLIRSIGTDHNRDPHTGVTAWPEGIAPIPAAAVSAPDAGLIARLAMGGKPVVVSLLLTPKFTGPSPSGNVVADLPGRDRSLPPVLVGCHLDSWDLATGAIDNASGCAIITAAALEAAKAGPLQRTIRVLWAGGEERGGFGGAAYAKAHAGEPHALAMESDFGADRVYSARLTLAPTNEALGKRVIAALNPLGIPAALGETEGGEDVGPIAKAQKLAVIDLRQDGTHYFDLHHTQDDTLDKIDPAALAQNVEAWAAVLRIVADEPGPIGAIVGDGK